MDRPKSARLPMNRMLHLAGLAGLVLAIVLVASQGFADIYHALAAAGWGLLLVTLFHLVPMTLDTLGWVPLIPRSERPLLRVMIWARWVREAVDGLLPVAQVGGEVVATRLLVLHKVPGALAGASLVVDVTIAVFTQLVFTVLGLALLFQRGGNLGIEHAAVMGLVGGTGALAGFLIAQRRGLFERLTGWLVRAAGGRRWLGLVGGAARLDAEVRQLHRQRSSLVAASLWMLASWIAGAGEVWLALRFLGWPVDITEALILESLGQAVRSAAFAVPGSLGVQEGGYMAFAGLFGLTAEAGLALSLAKRVRELLLGLPALAVWQFVEGHRLWRTRKASHREGKS